jgi:hypothetical protein
VIDADGRNISWRDRYGVGRVGQRDERAGQQGQQQLPEKRSLGHDDSW